jgi:hypothetical protein
MELFMEWKSVHPEAAVLIASLPPIPQPWSIDELCRLLAAQRNRTLMLHALNVPGLPFGLWFDDSHRDHIIYRTGLAGYYRDHVILHEICHMVAKHNSAEKLKPFATDRPDNQSGWGLLEYAMQNRHTQVQEELAEMFASKILRMSLPLPSSAFEQRAAAVFGAT